MSKKISGLVYQVSKSSNINDAHIEQGNGRGNMKSIVPDMKLQNQPNLKKDTSTRGKGDGELGEILGGGRNLVRQSTYVEPWSFFSVGGGLLLEDNKDENGRKMKRMGKRMINIPKREGKDAKSGQTLPAKKEQNAPTKTSDLVGKQEKRTGISYKKDTSKKVGGPKLDMKAPNEISPNDVSQF